MSPARVCAIVPLYNHAATVVNVVRGAAAEVPLVLVVDDGSDDGGGDVARSAASSLPSGSEVEVLRLPSNRGKGAAVLAGLRRAAERGCTHALVLDADGQHRAADIPRFLSTLAEHRNAILVGVRDLEAAHIPKSSRVGRGISNFWFRRTTGLEHADTQSGFRLYPVEAVLALPVRARGYAFEVEVLVRGAWAGIEIAQVPIDVWYPPPAERVSHFRSFVDNAAISLTYTRLAMRRLWPAGFKSTPGSTATQPRLRDTWRRLRAMSVEGARPTELAMAFAMGVLVGASPLWGLHSFLAIFIAARLHLNAAAAFLGSAISNPFFAPYLIFASVQVGHLLLNGSWIPVEPGLLSQERIPEYLLDYLVGSMPVALLLATLAWAGVRAVFALRARPEEPRASVGSPPRRRPFFSAWVFTLVWFLLAIHIVGSILLLPWTLLFDRDRRASAALGAMVWRASLRLLWPGAPTTVPASALQPERPAVVVLNHRSMLDIAIASALPGAPRLAGKPWVGRIPGLGTSLSLAGHLLFDPSDPSSVRDLMERMEGLLRRGVSVAVFPEGTRGTGPDPGAFQRGAFRLAVRTGVDVLPVVLHGTGETLPRGGWMFTDAPFTITVLPRVPAGDDEEALRVRVREAMLSVLATPQSL
jgi:1-acyl-sn-glycerol-3-phosphate acyltransferase